MKLDLTGYYKEFGAAKNGYFKRNMFYCMSEKDHDKKVLNLIREYKNTDFYQCVYVYSNKEIEESKLYAPLYFDLDGDMDTQEGFDLLKKDVNMVITYFKSIGVKEEEIDLYFSGSKGFHVIIPAEVLGITPSMNLNQIYKAWAIYLYNTYNVKSIDLKIYDKRRLLRQPYSINSKTGLFKVLIDISKLHSMTLETLKNIAKNSDFLSFYKMPAREKNLKAAKEFYEKSKNVYKNASQNKNGKQGSSYIPSEKQNIPECVMEILKNGVGEGGRNNTLVLLASGLLQSGYSLEEVVDIAMDWNETNEPPLNNSEVDSTVKSAYTMLLGGKRYGCCALKEAGYCINENCRIAEKMNENLKLNNGKTA